MIPGLVSAFYRPSTSGSFSVTISTPSVSGVSTAGPVTSGSVTVVPSGGTAPYAYLWIRTNGDHSMTADTGTAASTTFSETLNGGDSTSASFWCRVTDASAKVIFSPIVTSFLRATSS